MNCLFEVRNAGVRYGAAEVLRSASLKLHAGEFVAIAGPNGAGKSTLLSLIAGLLKPSSGDCLFLNRAAHRWDRREFARRVAVVMQAESSAFPFTVEEVVAMGRMPHSIGLYENSADRAAVTEALAQTGIETFRTRAFYTLSGGERQRVLLASALAQQPEVLLLDEPANHLDLEHQLSLHRLLRNLSKRNLLIVTVTHDLNLAAAFAQRIVLMHEGAIRANGPVWQVLQPDTIEKTFNVHVEVHHRVSGTPWLVYGE